MSFYTITENDVDQPIIRCFGRSWTVTDFIGRILPRDVGKRVFLRDNILQVENNEQLHYRQMKRFVRLETQLSRTTGLVFRASVYGEGTIEKPGEIWCASCGWNENPAYPLQWLESVYPELAKEWQEISKTAFRKGC